MIKKPEILSDEEKSSIGKRIKYQNYGQSINPFLEAQRDKDYTEMLALFRWWIKAHLIKKYGLPIGYLVFENDLQSLQSPSEEA